MRQGAPLAFVDAELLPQLDGEALCVPIVGIMDEALAGAVRLLDAFPWLSHVVAVSMLSSPLARAHLSMLLDRLEEGPEQRILGDAGIGRVALLASSSHRETRFERMREFFAKQRLSSRAITSLNDLAEELVTNALYDAPVEAGYFATPVPRTVDVDLPPERACEISYGVENSTMFVRVRDPFGALTRPRLLGVLNRCNAADGVVLDETRGGAGLGLWRIFSAASSIAITVIPGRLTDILVRIETKKGRPIKQLLAIHTFFVVEEDAWIDGAQGRFAADHDYDLMDDSFTFVRPDTLA